MAIPSARNSGLPTLIKPVMKTDRVASQTRPWTGRVAEHLFGGSERQLIYVVSDWLSTAAEEPRMFRIDF